GPLRSGPTMPLFQFRAGARSAKAGRAASSSSNRIATDVAHLVGQISTDEIATRVEHERAHKTHLWVPCLTFQIERVGIKVQRGWIAQADCKRCLQRIVVSNDLRVSGGFMCDIVHSC